jgi:hypothetical protein
MVHALDCRLNCRQHVLLEFRPFTIPFGIANNERQLAYQVLYVMGHESIALIELLELANLG